MGDKENLIRRLQGSNLCIDEELGQNFLTNFSIISELSDYVTSGNRVIEVGAGIGHVTKALAQRAGSVVGIEIDRRLQPYLDEVASDDPRISIIYGDVLKMDLARFIPQNGGAQVIANLPFHITEPFLYKLVDLRIDDALLLLGDNAAREFKEDENSLGFGKMSLVAQTFFQTNTVMHIDRSDFYPQPRTDACLVKLDPKTKKEIGSNPSDFIFAELIRRQTKNGLVLNDMKQAIVDFHTSPVGTPRSKQEFHQNERSSAKRELKRMNLDYDGEGCFQEDRVSSQSQAIRIIEKMGIPNSALEKPFSRLDNQDIRELAKGVREFYG